MATKSVHDYSKKCATQQYAGNIYDSPLRSIVHGFLRKIKSTDNFIGKLLTKGRKKPSGCVHDGVTNIFSAISARKSAVTAGENRIKIALPRLIGRIRKNHRIQKKKILLLSDRGGEDDPRISRSLFIRKSIFFFPTFKNHLRQRFFIFFFRA